MSLRDGVIEIHAQRLWPEWCAAQTLGHIVYYARNPRRVGAALRRHEQMHVRQAERWGVFFLLAYPLASLVAFAQGRHYYGDNYFERQARDASQ